MRTCSSGYVSSLHIRPSGNLNRRAHSEKSQQFIRDTLTDQQLLYTSFVSFRGNNPAHEECCLRALCVNSGVSSFHEIPCEIPHECRTEEKGFWTNQVSGEI